jgi:von Willebrand factor type A domain
MLIIWNGRPILSEKEKLPEIVSSIENRFGPAINSVLVLLFRRALRVLPPQVSRIFTFNLPKMPRTLGSGQMRILAVVACLALCGTSARAVPLFDVVILLDESGSVSNSTFAAEKNFATEKAQSLHFGPNDTAASLIIQATSARVITNFTASKQTFINSVSGVAKLGGSSNFTPGLTAAQNQFNNHGRAGAQKIIAIFGDGMAPEPGMSAKLDELAASGVDVFAFLLPGGNPTLIQSMVRNDGQYFVFTDSNSSAVAFLNGIYATLATVPDDYNYNGVVDAADYVAWRLKLSTGERLVNDSTPGVQPADYGVWRAHFGQVSSGQTAGIAVAEPSLLFPTIAALIFFDVRRENSGWTSALNARSGYRLASKRQLT